MSNPPPPNRLSFEENIKTLLDELTLAEKWQRPSLLLAIHKSKLGQDRAEKALEAQLRPLGLNVIHITVDQEQSDVPHWITGMPAPAKSVYFVSNLDWGSGADRKDAYRALNIYRELFVDHHIKAVFWLTLNEAGTLARFAPDFWAFRHRVIEFTGQRIPPQVKLPAGALVWDMQNTVDPYDTLEARIGVREELLAKLPASAESRSARVDLLNNLGYLYWSRGETAKASERLAAALDLVEAQREPSTASPLLNGLAIIAYEAGQYERCVQLLREGLQHDAENAVLLINLSAASSTLGRNQEALTIAKRAIRAGPRDARIWATLGYIYAATGKYDEAISSFAKAAELAPRTPAYPVASAICYALVDRPDQAAQQFERARNASSEAKPSRLDIDEAAVTQGPGAAIELARTAIESHALTLVELRRDPNLSLLLDAGQLSEIAG